MNAAAATTALRGPRPALLAQLAGVAVALVLGLLLAVDPLLGIAAALTVAMIAGFSRSATIGMCGFVFVTYFEIVGAYTGSTALSPIKLAGGALVILAVLTLATRRTGSDAGETRPAWSRHPLLVAAMLGYVVWGAASAIWAIDLAQVISLSTRLVTDALIFLAIGVFLHRPRQFEALAWSALGGGVAATLVGLAIGATTMGRLIGTFTDPNDYAAAMVASIALGFGAVATAPGAWTRRLGWAGIALCGYGLLMSQSRGGMLALAVAALVIVLTARGRERVRMTGAVLLLVAAALGFLVLTAGGSATLQRITDGDSSGRSDLWRVARAQFVEHPVRGVGLGNYPVVSLRYITSQVEHTDLFTRAPRTTHSTPLEVAAELGVVGILTFTGFIAGCLVLAVRGLRGARRLGDRRLVDIGRGILAATAGLLGTCIFLSGQYQEMLWVLLAMCVAYETAVRRAQRPA